MQQSTTTQQIESHLDRQYSHLRDATLKGDQKQVKVITENIIALEKLKRLKQTKSLPDFVKWVETARSIPDIKSKTLILEATRKYGSEV